MALISNFLLPSQVGAAISVYVFRGEVDTIVTAKMNEGLTNYEQGDKYKGVTDTWNAVQSDFKCCGVSNYSNWQDTKFGKEDNGVPMTCCKTASEGCGEFDNIESYLVIIICLNFNCQSISYLYSRKIKNRKYFLSGSLQGDLSG